MNTELLLACWGMMTLMVLVPGPDWAYIIDAGMRDRTILPSLGGILVGYLAAVAAVAVGVGAAVAALPWVLVGLTFAAAGYLAYLGIRVLRQPPELVAGDAGTAGGHGEALGQAAARTDRPWRRLAQGAGVSGLNPKGLLVLVVLLPQFTDAAGAWPIPVQLAVLGLIFVAQLCARLLRRRHGRENGAPSPALGDPHPLPGLGRCDGRARGRARRRAGHASRRRVIRGELSRSLRAALAGCAAQWAVTSSGHPLRRR